MKLFGFNLGPNSDLFRITEEDRLWVNGNFKWLIQVFGYPNKEQGQFLVNETYFPKTFSKPSIEINPVIQDLCDLLCLDNTMITIDIQEDIRDWQNMPYAIEGRPFECDTDLKTGNYRIYIAKSLLKRPNRLIFNLVYEFIRIRLTESEIEYDSGGDDTPLFIYLAAIYYGFGVILAQRLHDTGRDADGMWEIKWNYMSEMPLPVMAFSLATYASLTGEDEPAWKKYLSSDFRKLFEDAIQDIRKNPEKLADDQEIKAMELFNQANEAYDQNHFEEAISTLQKILFLTNDDHLKSDVYNNIGYYYLRRGDYNKSIPEFRKALELGSEYGYANDNLGYALIMTGDLENGYEYLQRALKTKNNDAAYSFRNLALYHALKGEKELAETFFEKAFQEQCPVDLLEYHYAQFLYGHGKKEKAFEYLQQAVDKKEPEAIDLMVKWKG
jgi:tetratricopeptide (TPR) repeat protein